MRISDILSLLKEYILLGIAALIVLGILFFIGYKIIYKKVMKGKKTISRRKLVLYSVSICYIVIVLGAVFFNRTSLYGDANLHIFSSYKEAYNKMEISLFRNIVLNILLFVPLGVLIPIYFNKLNKSYIVILIGFLFSLIIEVIQYITRMGIFEVDDIFNNTLGGLIGYSIFMIYNSIRHKENRKYIVLYVLPILIVVAFFIGIYIKYESQEFGNLSIEYDYKVNMKNINIESKCNLLNERVNKDIFYKKILNKEETKNMAENIFRNLGTNIDESRTDIYENTAIYYSNDKEGSGYSVWIDFKGGTYSYTDFSSFSYAGKKNIKTGASKEEVKISLGKIGIQVPKNAIFKEEKNGIYVFQVDMEFQVDKLIDGVLECAYYEDNTIKTIKNNIVEYEKVNIKEIISEEEAYNKILEGKFKYDEYNIGKIKDMIINGVKLEYFLDSKGYYVPIYVFDANMNGRNTTISINAIKT